MKKKNVQVMIHTSNTGEIKPRGKKRETELLATIFSFSHNVSLTLSQTGPGFYVSAVQVF